MPGHGNHAPRPAKGFSLRKDLLASIVVFLVALPLCMGIAIASGAPVAAGLITGIVGGIVVGMLAGSPLQVSGPAAGLTVIIYEVIVRQGLPMLGVAVAIAGLLQIAAGALKLGQWFRAVSPAVIKGMLSGIGVLILASQFHVMVDDKPKGSGMENLLTIPDAIVKGLPWPKLTPYDDRQWRTEKLQQVGVVHEHQEEMHELVAEQVSKQPSPDEAAREAELLKSLVDRQQHVTSELEALAQQLDERPTAATNRKRGRIATAAAEAVAASHTALADLKQGDVTHVLASQEQASAALTELLASLKNHDWAAKIGLATILIIVGWQMLTPKSLKLIPGPLLAIVAVTALTAFLRLPVLYVETPDNLWDAVHFPSWIALADANVWLLAQSAIVIAIIASAETLLCATAVDQMHQGPRTQYDRELLAQGVGNTICGLVGALPMTGVIVRSAANVQAGGTSRWSAVMHGVWLFVFVVFLGFVLRLIPTSALAAILVYTGYKLINPKSVLELWRYGKGEALIYLTVVVVIVVEDLLAGVLTGVVLSAVKLLFVFSRLSIRREEDVATGRTNLWLKGAATFLRLPKLADALESVPQGAELHVHMDELAYIDHACLDLLMNWAKQHRATGGRLVIDWDSLTARFREPKQQLAEAIGHEATNGNGHAASSVDAAERSSK